MNKADATIAQQFGMFALVVSTFAGASAAGVGLGWLLWKKAGFPSWTIAITSLLGLTVATLQVVRYNRVLNRGGNLKGDGK